MKKTITVKNGTEGRRLTFTPALGEWIFTTDSERTYMGDGKTPGGVSVDKKHYEVSSADDISKLKHCRDGDTCDVDGSNSIYFHVNGVWVEINKSVTPPAGEVGDWEELSLDYGWSNVDPNDDEPRVRKIGNEIQIDATLSKVSYSNYSPFILPVWARPSKTQYLTAENSAGQGATSVAIFPDGSLYIRKYATRSLSRISFNLRYFTV